MTASLSDDKKTRIRALVNATLKKTAVTLDEVLQLAGHLGWAARVIPIGKAYNGRLWPFIAAFRNRYCMRRRLPKDIQDDCIWWLQALEYSQGTRIINVERLPQLHLFTDASDIGLGAF